MAGVVTVKSVFLNLLVIRSSDLLRAADFYQQLGIVFNKEKHGTGPEHLCGRLAMGAILEIYPLTTGQMPTRSLHLGFGVADIDTCLNAVQHLGAEIVQPAHDSPWGRRAVIRDFDGHTIELITVENEG